MTHDDGSPLSSRQRRLAARSNSDKELLLRIGARIRETRLRRDWTIAQVAAAVSIDAAYLGELERGRESVSITTLDAIARELRVTLTYLVRNGPAER